MVLVVESDNGAKASCYANFLFAFEKGSLLKVQGKSARMEFEKAVLF